MQISLENIEPTDEQTEVLYLQLKKRMHAISHKKIPLWDEHINFVENHPYRAWFLLKANRNIIGNAYIQFDNSIGLNCDPNVTAQQFLLVLKKIQLTVPPLEGIPSIRNDRYHVNISSSDKSLQAKFCDLKFEEIQRTYLLPNTLG